MADGYEVTGQRQTSNIEGGRLERVWVVSWRSDDGDVGEVEVPVRKYTADYVHELVAKDVQTARDIRSR